MEKDFHQFNNNHNGLLGEFSCRVQHTFLESCNFCYCEIVENNLSTPENSCSSCFDGSHCKYRNPVVNYPPASYHSRKAIKSISTEECFYDAASDFSLSDQESDNMDSDSDDDSNCGTFFVCRSKSVNSSESSNESISAYGVHSETETELQSTDGDYEVESCPLRTVEHSETCLSSSEDEIQECKSEASKLVSSDQSHDYVNVTFLCKNDRIVGVLEQENSGDRENCASGSKIMNFQADHVYENINVVNEHQNANGSSDSDLENETKGLTTSRESLIISDNNEGSLASDDNKSKFFDYVYNDSDSSHSHILASDSESDDISSLSERYSDSSLSSTGNDSGRRRYVNYKINARCSSSNKSKFEENLVSEPFTDFCDFKCNNNPEIKNNSLNDVPSTFTKVISTKPPPSPVRLRDATSILRKKSLQSFARRRCRSFCTSRTTEKESRKRVVSLAKSSQDSVEDASFRPFFGDKAPNMKWVAERKKTEGNGFYKLKQYKEAISLYTEAIDLCPECASYYSNRSACYMMLNKFSQALTDAREAVRLDANFVKGYIRVAKCNIALGEPNAALSVLRQAIEIEPHNKGLKDETANANALLRYQDEVQISTTKKDYRTAIYHLDRAIELAIGCRNLKTTKAEYLVYLLRHNEAQEMVNEILQFDPGNADAIYVRGMCLYYQDNPEAAFTHFQHVLRLAPDHKKARDIYKKAKLLKIKKEEGNQAFKKGSLREALNLYTEALAIDVNNRSTNSKLYCNRATVKSKLGKHDDAIDDCTAAINLNEGYVKAYLRRAKSYQEVDKHEEAVRDYEKVYKLDKSHEYKRLLHEAKVQLKCSKRKDYYKILGVSREASDDDIKKSYKKKALLHHPDRHANATDKEKHEHEIKFKEIGEAYAILTDSKKRGMYDRGQDVNDPDCGGFGHDDLDPNQIFQAFFGGQGGSGFQTMGGFPGAAFQSGGGGFPGGFHFQFG